MSNDERMGRRRLRVIGVSMASLVLGVVVVHDLALYRTMSIGPKEYCRVSEASSAERGLPTDSITTNSADSGCRSGEEHLCMYQRFVLSDVFDVREPPC